MIKTIPKIFCGCLLVLGAYFPAQAAFPIAMPSVAPEQHTTVPANNIRPAESAPQYAYQSQEAREAYDAPKASTAHRSAGNSGKSQLIALLLVLFVGILGIHRFYLGYTWQGIVQLLTLGGLGIWTFIDLIRIITGSLQPKNGSYDQTI